MAVINGILSVVCSCSAACWQLGRRRGRKREGGGRSTVLCKRVGLFEVVSAVYAQRREVFDGGEISRVYLGR